MPRSAIHRIVALGAMLLLAAAASNSHAQTGTPGKTIKIGATPTVGVAPVFLADLYGYLKEDGLAIELITFRDGGAMHAAGMAGSIDLMATALEQVARFDELGAPPWRIVNGLYGANPFAVIIRPNLNIPAGNFAALKGLKIGAAQGRAAVTMMRGLLNQAGLNPDKDVDFIDFPVGAVGIPAWEKGQMDVGIGVEPVISALISKGSAKMFADLRTGNFGPISKVPTAGLAASARLIEQDRGMVEKIVKAMCRAAKRGSGNADESADLLVKAWGGGGGGSNREQIRAGIKESAPAWKLDLPPEPINYYLKVLLDNGSLKKQTSFERIVDVRFRPLWSC